MSFVSKLSADSLFSTLCKIYIERRRTGMNPASACKFSADMLEAIPSLAITDADDLHQALYTLSQQQIIYYTLDGECDLTESITKYLDKQYKLD